MKIVEPAPFGQRLLEVFGELVPKDTVREKIMEVLGVKKSALTNYLQDRIPDTDKLQAISEFTNCSIHWLITGEGEKYLNQKQINLDDTFRGIVREMIREEMIKEKVIILSKDVKNEKEKTLKPTSSPSK